MHYDRLLAELPEKSDDLFLGIEKVAIVEKLSDKAKAITRELVHKKDAKSALEFLKNAVERNDSINKAKSLLGEYKEFIERRKGSLEGKVEEDIYIFASIKGRFDAHIRDTTDIYCNEQEKKVIKGFITEKTYNPYGAVDTLTKALEKGLKAPKKEGTLSTILKKFTAQK